MGKIEQNIQTGFYNKIANLLKEARKNVVQTVNKTMFYTYCKIGQMVVEEEQNGQEHAEYGKQILKELSRRLNSEFGKVFAITNLQQMKNFYNVYGKQQTLSAKSEIVTGQNINLQLSWSHYLLLMQLITLKKEKEQKSESRRLKQKNRITAL